jgi:hypothetical protein
MDSKEALALVNKINKRLSARRPEIDMFEQYYAGHQKLTFATDEWLKANGARYSEFSDNWCASVTNAIGERTKVLGIKLRGEDPMVRDIATQRRASGLWDHWLRNQMDAQSSQGFLTSFNAKRSYVMVWGDDAEITWEHPANVEIEYDWMNPRKRTAALKTWVDESTEYANLYTATELWKFSRPRSTVGMDTQPQSVQMGATNTGNWGAWTLREVAGEPNPQRNPMGVVPIVEVPNRPMLRGEPVSEIETVIPKQNAVNLLWAYLFFAADYASMPARVLLGASPPMRRIPQSDGTFLEQPLTMKELNETRFAVFSGEHAKVDQWDAAKLDVFTDVIDILVGHIHSQTRTPPTYLISKVGMSNVSEGGLEGSEIGLVNKQKEFQTFANPAIQEIFRLVALAKGEDSLADEVRMSTIVWKNPEIQNDAQLSDALLKKRQTGYPLEWIMEQDGIDPYDMARIKQMLKAEADVAMSIGVQAAIQGEMIADQPGMTGEPIGGDAS